MRIMGPCSIVERRLSSSRLADQVACALVWLVVRKFFTRNTYTQFRGTEEDSGTAGVCIRPGMQSIATPGPQKLFTPEFCSPTA